MLSRDEILQTVLSAGFDRVGCVPLSDAVDPKIDEWLDSEYQGEMDYLRRHAKVRAAPRDAFPRHRSVLVASLEYGDGEPPSRDPKIGNISRYALGTDYHSVLKSRLLTARAALQARWPELRARAFVDAGPLNEKLLAARAGLGFVGRHTNLIDPRRGSYFFLGILLVSAELAATGPMEPDRCGTCIDCIPACPTGAIVAPYVLDARRCISYLTIELAGSIPRDLRPLIGNRIFGCDDCQEVCPWNRFAKRSPPPEFAAIAGRRDTGLRDWLEITETQFETMFAGSAVHRATWRGFIRNVLVASGCSGDLSLVPTLARQLEFGEALHRVHAAWALGELICLESLTHLRLAEARETDSDVRLEVLQALNNSGFKKF